MHIVYSALNQPESPRQLNNQLAQRLQGYQAACKKRQAEIAAIQRYFPGWQPPFEAGVVQQASS